jgi:hypothetical protein
MKPGFRSSSPREPITIEYCRGNPIRTEIDHAILSGTRLIGLEAVGYNL